MAAIGCAWLPIQSHAEHCRRVSLQPLPGRVAVRLQIGAGSSVVEQGLAACIMAMARVPSRIAPHCGMPKLFFDAVKVPCSIGSPPAQRGNASRG